VLQGLGADEQIDFWDLVNRLTDWTAKFKTRSEVAKVSFGGFQFVGNITIAARKVGNAFGAIWPIKKFANPNSRFNSYVMARGQDHVVMGASVDFRQLLIAPLFPYSLPNQLVTFSI
jgi:hypothetical protein